MISSQISDANSVSGIPDIEKLDAQLTQVFETKLVVQSKLTRQLVTFQANKTRPIYRWYKYKEAFSADLVDYFLITYGIQAGIVFDPFAGVGTTLFAASALGVEAHGVELLPVGQQAISTRLSLANDFTSEDFAVLESWIVNQPWKHSFTHISLPTLRITRGAYPPATVAAIENYLAQLANENERVQGVLRFALLCIVESISYTRKDGQYLRWDYRSGRRQGQRPFNKGAILNFEQAINAKLREIIDDSQKFGQTLPLFQLEQASEKSISADIHLQGGSCIEYLPTIPDRQYDGIITSPPYCNRYDYTRTYALELALLNVSEQDIVHLRQQMLSCTVENRAKDLRAIKSDWAAAIEAADHQELLQEILRYLDAQNDQGKLNNKGIPRMVRGYFYEMACVIAECARVLKSNTPLIMVNDNVRYAGVSISVDLILSEIASHLGFIVEEILVLPKGKGNSSQQMGRHGRDSLRKCVYVWRKA